MIADDINIFMDDAVSEVLETMCFMASEGHPDGGSPEDMTDWLTGEVEFLGNSDGSFGIAVPATTAVAMAANFLGEDESELDHEQIAEVVGEMTNMVCGALLSHLDSKNAFTLSSPRHDCGGIRANGDGHRICRTYRLDEGFIFSWLEVRAGL